VAVQNGRKTFKFNALALFMELAFYGAGGKSVHNLDGDGFIVSLKDQAGLMIDSINGPRGSDSKDLFEIIFTVTYILLERNREKHNIFPLKLNRASILLNPYFNELRKGALEIFLDLYSAKYSGVAKLTPPPSNP